MAQSDGSAFSRVLSAFQSRLSPEDARLFRFTTFEDLEQATADIQQEQAQRRGLRNLKKIQPFLNGLEQYRRVIDTFVNTSDILAFVWGPIKLCLQIASKFEGAFDALLDAYGKIGNSLPIFSRIDHLSRSNKYVQQVLADVYEDILDFHKRAVVFFRQSTWRLAFQVPIRTFGDLFGDVIKKLERSKELLLQSANITQFQEAQESRLLFAREFEAQSERTQDARMLTVVDWLSPVSCQVDHEELQKKRGEYPQTTRWITKESSMRDWLQPSGSTSSMFWICGIPGAGKTVLFSSMVDEIKENVPESQVIYFYCKSRDPEKRMFHGVARSLIAQLLRLNPISLDYLYNTAVESAERHPTSIQTYKKILEKISTAHDLLFIGIDGLDECEEEDRRSVLMLLKHILNVSGSQGNVKIFLTSQKLNDLKQSLEFAIRLDIKSHHVTKDIQNYIDVRCAHLCEKFDYSSDQQKSLNEHISKLPMGMFLLARLVMDNLMDQDNIEELEEELGTEILPSGIDEAYGRILARLRKGRTVKSQSRIRRVLEILIAARRPLKVHEVQGALSISIEDFSIDFVKRRSLTSFSQLCGPIIEVHTDDTVSLVHPTAKQYLIQQHSGPYIHYLGAELRMATLCNTYLSLECFEPSIQEEEIKKHVLIGAYAFQEYATLHFISHSLSVLNVSMPNGEDKFTSLKKLCFFLQSRHYGPGIQPSDKLSLEQHESHAIRTNLARLQNTYDSVISISQNEASEDTMPYLLKHVYQVQCIVEELLSTTDFQSALLTEAYGLSVFKCPTPGCPRFINGYGSASHRNNHLSTHGSRYDCHYEGCDHAVLGFSTMSQLEKHLLDHEPSLEAAVFPKVQRYSLKKSLENSIDKDDVLSVRALSVELSTFPVRETGFFLRALKKGYHESARILAQELGGPEEFNLVNASGKTSLHIVAEIGDPELAQIIIRKGADVCAKTRSSDTAVIIAAFHGHAQMVKLLVEQDQSLGLDHYNFETLLRLAAKGGHQELSRVLLDLRRAADKQSVMVICSKFIRLVASRGHKSAVRLLLERGRMLKAENRYPEPLRGLAASGIEAMVVHVMEKTKREDMPEEDKPEAEERPIIFDEYFSRSLTAAVYQREWPIVQELLLQAEAAGLEYVPGVFFWGDALQEATKTRQIEMVRLLLFCGALVDAAATRSALHSAILTKNEKIVELLLDSGVDVNACKGVWELNTPLQLAVIRNDDHLVNFLLDRGAYIDMNNPIGRTALQIAVFDENKGMISLLLVRGAYVQADDAYGAMLLQAAKQGRNVVTKLLGEWELDDIAHYRHPSDTLKRVILGPMYVPTFSANTASRN